MTAQANTNAVAEVSELVNNDELNNVAHELGTPPELDQYGRNASERTVELNSVQAEAVDQEVTHGKHSTYDDALAYVIQRGLAEIKRQRDAARAVAEKTLIKTKRDSYANLMKSNPALITNSEFVTTMLRDLGVTSK